MKIHQRLQVSGDQASSAVAALVAAATPGQDWVNRVDYEQQHRSMLLTRSGSLHHCFESTNLPTQPLIWLHSFGGPAQWRVGAVVIQQGDGSMEECNAAVQAFHAWAEPLAAGVGVQVYLGPDEEGPVQWLGEDLANLLRAAVMHGNPTHPSDCERWNEFLCRVHSEGRDLAPSDLARWLVEDNNWADEEEASNLAIRFENGLELLQAYDRLR